MFKRKKKEVEIIDITYIKDTLDRFNKRIVMLECEHNIESRVFIKDYPDGTGYGHNSAYPYGYSKCNRCGKKIKYYFDEVEYKRDCIKHLQETLDKKNEYLNKIIASRKGE